MALPKRLSLGPTLPQWFLPYFTFLLSSFISCLLLQKISSALWFQVYFLISSASFRISRGKKNIEGWILKVVLLLSNHWLHLFYRKETFFFQSLLSVLVHKHYPPGCLSASVTSLLFQLEKIYLMYIFKNFIYLIFLSL